MLVVLVLGAFSLSGCWSYYRASVAAERAAGACGGE
jgi:hypothetical protein